MLPKDNAAYFLRREDEERAAAAAATCQSAHDSHFILAERYADLAWAIDENFQ